jgi:probable F420-dependent oxidoreductase
MSTIARSTAAALGPIGAWSFGLDGLPIAEAVKVGQAIEDAGFGALWIAEGAASREALTHAAMLLAGTSRIIVGTGIASIWARDPAAMEAASRTLADGFPERFVLGVGVSHAGAVARRGHEYGARPLSRMREYLQQMDEAELKPPQPSPRPARILAALRPRMLELAGERADGAHTYFVPVAHTRLARASLGANPLLVTELATVPETDPTVARLIAREHTSHYLARENYRENLRTLGFSEDDLSGAGSDLLVDELVAWGDAAKIQDRIAEHRHAGADHVVLQPLGGATHQAGQITQFRRLATAAGLG